MLDDYDFDRGFDGKYNPELLMNFDIDECNRAVFNNTSDAVVKEVGSYLEEHKELFLQVRLPQS